MKRAKVTEEIAYGTVLERLTGTGKLVQAPPDRELPERSAAMIKLSVFLNREEDAYLENLASIAKFSGGKKISKTKLIQSMVRAFGTTALDVRGVKTEEELLQRLNAQLRK